MSESQLVLTLPKTKKPKGKKRISKYEIYTSSLLSRRLAIPMKNVGENLKDVMETILRKDVEGKCVQEGFIKPNSCKILTYSSGELKATNVIFEVVFECQVCCPVEGMLINCVAKNITKAGIKAEVVVDDSLSPVVIFIARDHHFESKTFSKIKENDTLKVRVIGQRYELNDNYISIIAELVDVEAESLIDKQKKSKQRISSTTTSSVGKTVKKKGVRKLKLKKKLQVVDE
tara:strand:- start:5876 stop:6568 length:693 start_codon:yes stop_codon:yes gene_type:complete